MLNRQKVLDQVAQKPEELTQRTKDVLLKYWCSRHSYDSKYARKMESERAVLSTDMMYDAQGGLTRTGMVKKSHFIGRGAWVLVRCKVQVDPDVAPKVYNIYWASPHGTDGYDRFGRYCVEILTQSEKDGHSELVRVFPDEYDIFSEEKVRQYVNMGYKLNHNIKPITAEGIKSMDLSEDDKEIVGAFQLDGLTKEEALAELNGLLYQSVDNKYKYYALPPDQYAEALAVFGEYGIRNTSAHIRDTDEYDEGDDD